MYDFFISYTQANAGPAAFIHDCVDAAGYSSFFQKSDIRGGADFVRSMSVGLSESSTLIAVWSGAYFESEYALAELNAMWAKDPLNQRHSILPIILEACEIPPPFNTLTYVEYRDTEDDEKRQRLLYEIDRIREQDTALGNRGIPETNDAAAARLLLKDLELAHRIFRAQCKVRDALVHAMVERDKGFKLTDFETFLEQYFGQMTEDEKRLHEQVRGYTDSLEKLNRRALYYVDASRDFVKYIPLVPELKEHLEEWLKKYESDYLTSPATGVLYVGVKEKKPFPRGVENNIRSFVTNLKRS